jgi:hypothetical protein
VKRHISFIMLRQVNMVLPSGDGRDAVVKMCSGCHGLQTVMAQRRTRPEWQGLVQAMAGLGAPGEAKDVAHAVIPGLDLRALEGRADRLIIAGK